MIKRAKQRNSSEFCDLPYISLYITEPEVPISQNCYKPPSPLALRFEIRFVLTIGCPLGYYHNEYSAPSQNFAAHKTTRYRVTCCSPYNRKIF